ncbi:Piso0_002429 [Millerozyma farinosa CBS 7064]|uniref:Piso0_002429 protein n=1 Tax=Pichia sorbitophila (strain ATCC MYA-4447 / BCRC 22081 / CBS 7064 / NBRC 10061 / NRRL Y-12695) TaxID=559304 RepID=G8YCL0_PICSO|nr:Piso0_002429 [Millerozyma farinosa CBS 7064]
MPLCAHTVMCLWLVFSDSTRAFCHVARGKILLIIVYRAKCKYVTSLIVASVTWKVMRTQHVEAVLLVVFATFTMLGAVYGYTADSLFQTADSPSASLPPIVRRHAPWAVSPSTSIRNDIRVCALLLGCADSLVCSCGPRPVFALYHCRAAKRVARAHFAGC